MAKDQQLDKTMRQTKDYIKEVLRNTTTVQNSLAHKIYLKCYSYI